MNQTETETENIGKIRGLYISDSNGLPLHAENIPYLDIDPRLFVGLVSALSITGKTIFKEEFGQWETIYYGLNRISKIFIYVKELFEPKRNLFFIFIYEGVIPIKSIVKISTDIFIQNKQFFKTEDLSKSSNSLKNNINLLITSKYNSLFEENKE